MTGLCEHLGEWTPRTERRTVPEAPAAAPVEDVVEMVMQAVAPFAEARRAVLEVLAKSLGAGDRGWAPSWSG